VKFSIKEIFSIMIALILGASILTVKDMPRQACLFPLVIAIPALLLTIVILFIDRLRDRKPGSGGDEGQAMDLSADRSVPASMVVRRATIFFCWLFAFAAAIWLAGFYVAAALFVFLFLFLVANEKWWFSMVYTIAAMIFMIGLFDMIMNTFWIEGALQRWLGF